MTPEQHLTRFMNVYSTALRDLENGIDATPHLPAIASMITELAVMIEEIKKTEGRTRGYRALKDELAALQERIIRKAPVTA